MWDGLWPGEGSSGPQLYRPLEVCRPVMAGGQRPAAAPRERDGGADPEGLVSLPFCSKKLRILGLVPVALRGSVTVLGVCGKGKVNAGEREPK